MDIDSIKELEQMMVRFTGALIFVTHDRMFLQRIATRIVEIDRGKLFDQTCDYETFLVRRSADREAEETKNALFDRKLQQEEHWVRGGIKARRTRNEGRVRELERMREVRRSRRDRPGKVKMEAHEAERSGTLVAKADDIGFNYGDTQVISKFSTTILKGDRIGILGSNGSGKTTLLRLLLGMISPVTGTIRLGTNLQISYSDQLLEQLDENKTAIENVGDGNDTVTVNGKIRHIVGYLQDFLFSPDQARSLVSVLSGGERKRLMLARLFTRPSNLLVLDEPTNDLDIETLDLLEGLLVNYTGTILLVSHDRTFINNIVTSTVVFEGGSVVKEYVGGYDDWLRQRPQEATPSRTSASKQGVPPAQAPRARLKLGFSQQKELDALPQTIECLEREQQELFQTMGDPGLYKKDRADIVAANDRLEELKRLLAEAYARWEELEQIRLDGENSRLSK
jgi:ATP-binding cassette subfamily F protein uup